MKIKKTANQNRVLIIAIVAIALLGGTAAFAYYRAVHISTTTPSDSPSVNLSSATDDEKTAGNQAKSASAGTDNKSSNSTKDGEASPAAPTSGSVSITMSANAQNGSMYQIRYLINAVASGATCTLTLTKGSATVTKTAPVQALAQSSTCQGFDIPTSELSPGSWQARMALSGGSVTGSTEDTIQIQ
jgi:hypothetical protein